MKTAIINFTTRILGVICLLSLSGMALANGNPGTEAEDMLSESAESYMDMLFIDLKMGPFDGAPELTCVSQVNVSLSNLGYSIITPQMLLLGEDPPFDDFMVDIVGPLTDTIWCEQLEQLLQVKVQDTITGENCWGWVYVQDYIDPVLDCSTDTVLCNTNLDSLDFEALLDASDNCTAAEDLIVNYSYDLVEYSCVQGLAGYMDIEWSVEDASGNESECTQRVYFEKPPIESVMFPEDVTVFCPDANTDTEFTGVPTINGEPFDHFCDLVTFITDTESEFCGEEAKIVRTFMVMDWCTNFMRIGTQDIFVEDTLAPVINCPEDLSVGTDEHECEATFTIPGTTATDDCSPDSTIQITIMIEGIFGTYEEGDVVVLDTGLYTLQYIATDICGNKDTCETALSVVDDEEPSLVCEDFDVFLNTDGLITVGTEPFADFYSDNCGEADIDIRRVTDECNIQGNTDFGNTVTFCCEDAGTDVMVEVRVTDNGGNELSCMVAISVFDNMPPEAECQNITVSLDENGDAVIDATMVDNGSDDNCPIASYELTPSVFDCDDIGMNDVTLTVTDESGNSAECTAIVTVVDEANPIAICQDITVNLIDGVATITAVEIDNGSSDNCGDDLTLEIDIDMFDCDDIGENTVILTVTDPDGNTDTCSATVTVQDVMMPVCVPEDITVYLDENGSVTITGGDIDGGSSDACGEIISMVADPDEFDCGDTGENTVTLTVTDNSGNTSSCEAIVTVEDTISPVALCQDVTVFVDGGGDVSVSTNQVDGGSSDNCVDITLEVEPNSFNCDDIGDNNVTLTVTDNSGNTDECEAVVTVEDILPPLPECDNITVYLDEAGNATIVASEVDGGSTDNCDNELELEIDISEFDCEDIGTVNVTLTVTDDDGNSATCVSVVTVEDTIPPVAECQNITVQLDDNGNATITASEIDNGSSDICDDDPSLSLDITNFDCADTENGVTVVLTVTDESGNESTCEAQVTVEDNIPPVAECEDVTIYLGENGIVFLDGNEIASGSTDNCDSVKFLIQNVMFMCDDVGTTSVEVIVSDAQNNMSTCSANVTVEDTISPTLVCNDFTLNVDENGMGSITIDQIASATDNCDLEDISASQLDFDCAIDQSPIEVVVTAEDVNGNVSTCTATITIQDPVPPTAECQDITVELDENGMATWTADDIDNGSEDNCDSDVDLSIDINSADCDDQGSTIEVTLTVTDDSGNSSMCIGNVTVVDSLAPVAICQDITVVLDENGQASIVASEIDNGSEDNCPGDITLEASQTDFNCDDVGVVEVILTVTDGNGNADTCIANVTVENEENITCNAQDVTVHLDDMGNATITPAEVNNGSMVVCGVMGLSLSQSSFDCDDLGVVEVFLIVDDGTGNEDSCAALITVLDTTSPICVVGPTTVYLDENGEVVLVQGDIDQGSSDNCDIVSFEIDPDTLTCEDLGDVNVDVMIEDQSGNTTACVTIVTVEDTLAPNPVCQDVTLTLDGNGEVVINAVELDGGSTDNCPGDLVFSVDPPILDCDDIGVNEVTLIVTDAQGNSDSCISMVTVEDDGEPTALCKDITVQLDDNGAATIEAADIDDGSFDACGEIADRTIDISEFDCDDIGEVIVTLTVTDNSGNTDSCTAIVTIEDNIDPTAVCVDITVSLDENGEATIETGDVDGGSSDNCDEITLSIDIDSFTCLDIGDNEVVLTVEDGSGNTDTCVAIVTISDTTAPTALCQDITVNLTNGQVMIEASDVDGGSTEECTVGGIDLSIDPESFDCDDIGDNEVVLTVTDDSNNSSTCVAIVTVVSDTPSIICPADIEVEPTDTTGVCDSAFVNIPVPTASDDDGILSIVHNSPFADNPGDDATGTYPAGITFITFVATDSCGISDSCTMSVMVNNSDTLAFECVKVIYTLPEEGVISFPADDFVNFIGGECNAGDSTEYFFSFTLDTSENMEMIVNCDSLDDDAWSSQFEVFIFTPFGDTLACLTGARVVDENGVCDNFAPLMISGELNYECNADPNDSYVHLDYQANNEQTVVNEDLYYEFSDLEGGIDYVVAPFNDDDPLEEISALDLVTINRHLLNIQPFTSPYQYIAADANHSESISALDMIEIRKLLLGHIDQFTNNTSWRFVDRKYQFIDENNPLDEDFPEFIFLESLTEEVRDAHFMSVKIGDVNYQVGEMEDEMEFQESENNVWLRSENQEAAIETPYTSWAAGDDIEVPLYFNHAGIEGFQMSFDLGSISVHDLYLESSLSGFNESHWTVNEGTLTVIWVGKAVDNPTITLMSKATEAGNVTELSVSQIGLTDELYTVENLIHRIDINYTDGAEELVLFQNKPNPFSEMTMIKFILPEEGPVNFKIMDASSKVIYELNQEYPAGENVIQIKKTDLKARGVLYYSLDSKNGSQTKKMTTID